MNNACPECAAVYAVAEKDIGRKIVCKKCSSSLVVAEEGLIRNDDDRAGAVPKKDGNGERVRDRDRDRDDEERGSRRRSRDEEDDEDDGGRSRARAKPKRGGPGAGEIWNKVKGVADVATWLYGFGLFLTIYSFFGPLIDDSKVKSRQGAIEEEAIDMDVYRRSINEKPDGKPPTADEQKKLEEKEKDWKKRQGSLGDDVKSAQASLKRAQWWNVMYRMFGFFLLAFGSIAYLKPEQTQLRRILGGVTILLILLQIVGGGMGLMVQAGGRPG